MSREVRRVPADWAHPKEFNPYRGCEVDRPLLSSTYADSFADWRQHDLPEWLEGYDQWQAGNLRDYDNGGYKPIDWEEFAKDPRTKSIRTYEDWAGACPTAPNPADHMPEWTEKQATHYQMYETTSEGTPISPVFATPEELARWLADTGASTFADDTADYDTWLKMIERGNSVASAAFICGRFVSGVDLAALRAAPVQDDEA